MQLNNKTYNRLIEEQRVEGFKIRLEDAKDCQMSLEEQTNALTTACDDEDGGNGSNKEVFLDGRKPEAFAKQQNQDFLSLRIGW